jgi:acyl-CoA thioesterase
MTSTLTGMLEVFDVTAVGPHRYVGSHDAGDRDIIDASQVLAQSIVAASASCPGKTVRRISGTFCRPIRAELPIELDVDVVQDGRTFATLVVTGSQQGRTCGVMTVMLDIPSPDVIRHPVVAPGSNPAEAIPHDMPLTGRELRLVGLADPNDPDEVGPPRIEAWLHYDQVPTRSDLQRALLAHFTGHLSISTTMRAHEGIGTAMAHHTVSTGVLAIEITFHDPVEWSGWLLYDHESTAVGAGTCYVRGQIRDESGRLIASFSQDGLIRGYEATAGEQRIEQRARL